MLKTLRQRSGLLQSQVAHLMGVTDITVGRWEKGTSSPSFETVARLAWIYARTGEQYHDYRRMLYDCVDVEGLDPGNARFAVSSDGNGELFRLFAEVSQSAA